MTDRMRCSACYFWESKHGQGESHGFCMRYPPVTADGDFPVTTKDEWCGEWKGSLEAVERSLLLRDTTYSVDAVKKLAKLSELNEKAADMLSTVAAMRRQLAAGLPWEPTYVEAEDVRYAENVFKNAFFTHGSELLDAIEASEREEDG